EVVVKAVKLFPTLPACLMVLLLLALFPALEVKAQASENFTLERFDALREQGAKILVNIGATDCSECEQQLVILTDYQEQFPNSDIHILQIDFNEHKEWVDYFRA